MVGSPNTYWFFRTVPQRLERLSRPSFIHQEKIIASASPILTQTLFTAHKFAALQVLPSFLLRLIDCSTRTAFSLGLIPLGVISIERRRDLKGHDCVLH